jgi:MYXO-CTERM domain-containing protein
MRSLLFVCSVVVLAALGSEVARADVAPPDSCTSPGQPCQAAGPQYNQAGICTTTVCTKYLPSPDGGGTTMRYDCNRCEVSDAGAGSGGTTASGGASGGAQGTGGFPSCCGSARSGCAVAASHPDGGQLGLALLIGVGLAVMVRRRAG